MGESQEIAVDAALSAFSGASQHNRLMRLDFPFKDGPPAILLPNKLVAHEEVSRGFRFDVEVLSDDPRIPLKILMGRMVTVSLVREDGSLRYFNGYVTEFRFLRSDGGFAFYQMVLEPWLALARLGKDSRSFHNKGVQKTLLIDYDYKGGAKAVGYVKGLNSVTDYWDTEDHLIEDPKRECGGEREAGEAVQVDEGKKADAGFKTFKPYRDYACRISGGALASVYANFVRAWGRAGGDTLLDDLETIPSALKRKGIPGAHSSVQIVRTQPEENDKTAKEMYFLATDTAAAATGYLYIENQYFQYQEWAERLIQARKNVMARWKAASPAAGKTKGDMPLLHVFIVMPVAERGQMVPRTYDTLAVLGQQAGMTGQSELIDKENKNVHIGVGRGGMVYTKPKPTVVEYANGIDKPSAAALGQKYGLKVAVAMLQSSGYDQRRVRYREIYIHSKLLLVDDSFFSLGSANLNQRSMAVDSEINLATNDARRAKDLRQKIWGKLSGGTVDGKNGSPAEIAEAFGDWTITMKTNLERKRNSQLMTGFLLPLEDNRSATLRLG